MKALQLVKYGKIEESLVFNEIEKPSIGTNDVMIEVSAVGINPIDTGIIAGELKSMINISLPASLAYDVSGKVIEIGTEVKNFEVGDLVYSRVPQEQMGTLTEFVAVNVDAVAKKPDNISLKEAASFPLAGLTALQCLQTAGINKNDKVLIHAGSGGVGNFAVQYAKAKGAYVYTTTSTENVDWVKALCADRVIDYKKEDYKTIVKDATIVLDTLGEDYTVDAFSVIAPGGKVISIAGPMDEKTAKSMGMADYHLPKDIEKAAKAKNASYQFIFMHPSGADLTAIKELIEGGKIKPVIDSVYAFEECVEAYQHLATGRAKGKIVIKIK